MNLDDEDLKKLEKMFEEYAEPEVKCVKFIVTIILLIFICLFGTILIGKNMKSNFELKKLQIEKYGEEIKLKE